MLSPKRLLAGFFLFFTIAVIVHLAIHYTGWQVPIWLPIVLRWIPLVIYMYASGDTWNAGGLFIYSLIVTGNVDYLARITLLKKMGHVHPVVTVLGVLIGLGLFGFIGLIFGPLLLNYIILLFKIYMNEFIENKTDT